MFYRSILLNSVMLSLIFSLLVRAEEKKDNENTPAEPNYQALSPYIAKQPKSAKALTSLSKAQQTKIQSLINKVRNTPDNVKIREILIKTLHQTEMYELLIKHALPYNDQLKKYNLLYLANALKNRYKYKEENKILFSLVTKDPDSYLVQNMLGTSFYNLRLANPAIQAFRNTIKIKPKFYPPYASLLSIFEETTNSYEQREILKIIIKNFGEKSDYYSKLCYLNYLEGFIQQGLKYCSKAYKLNKQDGKSLTLFGLISLSKGKVKNAEKAIRLAANKFKKNEFCQWAAGKTYFDKKNYHVAKRYFLQAVTADKTQARSHLGLAQTLYAMKDYKQGLSAFNKACQLDQVTTNDPFRVAANKLRQSRNYEWMDVYNKNSKKCRFIDLKK